MLIEAGAFGGGQMEHPSILRPVAEALNAEAFADHEDDRGGKTNRADQQESFGDGEHHPASLAYRCSNFRALV